MARILFVATALLACLVVTGPVRAANADADVPSMTVHYNELNLGNEAGVQTLYRRLTAAARQVCASQDGRRLQEQLAFRSCVALSLERAVREARNEAVLALHAEKSNAGSRG